MLGTLFRRVPIVEFRRSVSPWHGRELTPRVNSNPAGYEGLGLTQNMAMIGTLFRRVRIVEFRRSVSPWHGLELTPGLTQTLQAKRDAG